MGAGLIVPMHSLFRIPEGKEHRAHAELVIVLVYFARILANPTEDAEARYPILVTIARIFHLATNRVDQEALDAQSFYGAVKYVTTSL